MDQLYLKYRNVIKSILTNSNIDKILKDPLSSHFTNETLLNIHKSKDKVEMFFDEFDNIDNIRKYEDFLNVTNDISEWIKKFLSNDKEAREADEKFKTLFSLFRIQNDDYVNSLVLDKATLNLCHNDGLISDQLHNELEAILTSQGEINAKLKFFWNVNLKSTDCLGKLLWIYHRTKSDFIPSYLGDLDQCLKNQPPDEQKRKILEYGEKICNQNKNLSPLTLTEDITDSFCCVEEPVGEIDQCEMVDIDIENDKYYEFLDKLQSKTMDQLFEYPKDEKQPLNMRGYQNELATKAAEGENVLICSPTGSGKTIVAVKIVEKHLERNPKGKVAFLVHRTTLVDQQCKQFQRYLKTQISSLSGANKSTNVPLIWLLESASIFILTSDMLKNALEEKNETKLESINTFSLILFDECHNCDKGHPYNKIMDHYFKDKDNGKPVPQIVGLTASTGTNKAKSKEEALNQLFILCANLDALNISTVKDFKKELDEIQNKPQEEVMTPPFRPIDKFDMGLQLEMAACERMLQDMDSERYFITNSQTQELLRIPEDRLHQKYESFVVKLDKELSNYTSGNDYCKASLFAIHRYLKVFHNALMINHLFRNSDAIKLIQDQLCSNTGNNLKCPKEETLHSTLKKFIESCEKFSPDENPCLLCLKKTIKTQIESKADSRIIVFVRERAFAQTLKDIFRLELPHIKSDVILGSESFTKNASEEVLGRFKRGELSVLFSTTITEEGIDVPHCNMVIRYGHVTNETAMVQARGRARAADSRYILIVPNKLGWQVNKERINKQRESLMYVAIGEFQNMRQEEIKEKVEEYQFERKLNSAVEAMDQCSIASESDPTEIWNFHCKNCDTKICSSSDIRLADTIHHIVVNDNCFQLMALAEGHSKNQCKINCKCGFTLGNRQNYRKRMFPNLTIEYFSCKREAGGQSKTFRKWKDFNFAIANCTNKELLNFPIKHSLSD